jgi:hypothetical protein
MGMELLINNDAKVDTLNVFICIHISVILTAINCVSLSVKEAYLGCRVLL